MKKILWEVAKLFKGKRYIAIKTTLKCNLSCTYCSVIQASKIYKVDYETPPYFKEQSPEYWMKLIKKVKPDLITFSGGEPGLYKGLSDIINYAIDNHCLVQVLSNMTVIDEFLKIKPSWRVVFIHTAHKGTKPKNAEIIKSKFPVTIRILKENPVKGSRYEKKIITSADYTFKLMYAPDGTLYDNCDALALRSNAIVTNTIVL